MRMSWQSMGPEPLASFRRRLSRPRWPLGRKQGSGHTVRSRGTIYGYEPSIEDGHQTIYKGFIRTMSNYNGLLLLVDDHTKHIDMI